ncbi:MAG: beta-Ala-His dipeptidase, partial [Clostridiales bacterium]|nr:beta-Ala-His dipeptidase [Clostridiales bacterium]
MENDTLYTCARKWFDELCRIPRGSGNTEGVSGWLSKAGREMGLFVLRDAAGNVYMRSAEAPEKNPLLLQAHMDMVCEKDSGVKHDFARDPIYTVEEDGLLKARGTTLGADDGVGVAFALAALENRAELKPIEALFTVDEEIGLLGAAQFDMGITGAKRMINLDGGPENTAVVGAAGGEREILTLEYDPMPAAGTPVFIDLDGLSGGHSGGAIDSGKKNALRELGRVLCDIYSENPFSLIAISGGMKANAIPRSAKAVVACFDADAVMARVAELETIIKGEFGREDPDAGTFTLKTGKFKSAMRSDYGLSGELMMMSPRDTGRIISMLTLAPFGVIRKDGGSVITSTNMGICQQQARDGTVSFTFNSRSSVESELDAVGLTLERLAHMLTMDIERTARYPAWTRVWESKLQNQYADAYAKTFGGEINFVETHGGLEGGILKANCPGLDVIATGPATHDVHTPRESLDLASYERFCAV